MNALILCLALAAQAADSTGWQDRVADAVAADPERASIIWDADPIRTRNGHVRFADDAFGGAEAAPLIVDRFLRKGDDSGTRAALVDAAQRSRGDWGEALVDALPNEADAWVRATIVTSLTRADAGPAATGIVLGASDVNGQVRAAAMRAIAGRDDMSDRIDLVIVGLSDLDPEVRTAAAKAAGWRQMASTWDTVAALLEDSDIDVQVGALRAMERLDADRAAALPQVRALVSDSNHRVSGAAKRIVGR